MLDNPKIRPVIRQLDEAAINRIAAGEVVERPSSAVKELVENAIDAGARRVTIDYADGGKTLIRVTDDGCGMTPGDLPLALSRHATSKIDGSDLLAISSFGFRGEALPSLGAVGRLAITSRADGSEGATISVSGGRTGPVRPAALGRGTVVELRDLFFATPARLKFLRTDRAEAQAIGEVVRRLALAEPTVGFVLRDVSGGGEGRVVFRADPEQGAGLEALKGRVAQVLGPEFAENALAVDVQQDGLRLTGFAALPTYSRGSSVAQFLCVNGRPVLDRMLLGALRAAYFDFLSRDRHPAAVLRLDCDPQRVDVNVHPAKAEVRFREPALARGLIVSGLRQALADGGRRASSTVGAAVLEAMRPEARIYQMDRASQPALNRAFGAQAPMGFAEAPAARVEPVVPADGPLGAARAQLHETYILAQTATGLVIVDAHAAHERLVYERLKRQMAETGVAAQALLIPEIVELGEADAARLMEHCGGAAAAGADGGAVWRRCGGGPRGAGHSGPGGCRRADPRRAGRTGGLGVERARPGPDRGGAEPDGLPWLGPVGAADAGRGNERAAARDGGHSSFRAVQPRATDLCGVEAVGYREAVRAHMTIEFPPGTDPFWIAAGAALLVLVILLLTLRAAARAGRMAEPMMREMGWLGQRVQLLSDGQERLTGGLSHVSEAQAVSQTAMLQMMERRLAEVQAAMGESLHGTATRTARSLGELQQRLETIDKAQANIEKLSGNVLSLQDILSNKQTRGAFGEIQLHDIVQKALPAGSYAMQATLSNGKRADCLIHLPNPPGPIVVDSKFPLEAYEALRRAETQAQLAEAGRALRTAVKTHIKAIAERYILEGETADGAMMFLPSEAVYAELHANFPDVVREGFAARVWIVSPTTCMATLHTMRAILKDARMREQAGAIRRELALLHGDVDRLGVRVESLDRHFNLAAKDISDIRISSDKAGRRAKRLDNFDFEELSPDPAEAGPPASLILKGAAE